MSQMNEKIKEVERILYEYLPKEEGFQKTVCLAMNYSIKAGGKRLRPLLIQESYAFFTKEPLPKQCQLFMAALEMIHTYSLIHDDLPAMDNDELRRGLPTTHIQYGEAMAILAGDGLLNRAYELASQSFSLCTSSKELQCCIDAMQVLTSKAGIYGMVGGQVVDVEMEGCNLSKEQLDFIYELKTSALIEAAMMIGAIFAKAEPEEIKKMEQVARKVGIAFQIQDDILDVTSSSEELGKPIGSDEKNHKTTYVALYGMEAARKQVELLSGQAIELLKECKGENPFLFALLEMLIHRKK